MMSGKLHRPKICSKCKKICLCHAHHSDYTKPFKIIWLCNSCHAQLHSVGMTKKTINSPEAIEKRRLSMIGNQFAKGNKLTREHKEIISKFHIGKCHALGYRHSQEECLKISLTQIGKKRSLAQRKKMSIA